MQRTNHRHTTARHELLHALALCAGVIVAVTFHQVDRAPNAQASAQSNHQGLQYFDSGIEKCHIVYLQKMMKFRKGHIHVELL